MASSSSVLSMSDGASPLTHALGPQNTHAFKPPRACEGCRSLKVQCVFDSSQPSACRRCIKARRRCVITERRKRRVVESSVTDLEKKLNALNADLEAIKSSSHQVEGQPQEPGSRREYDTPASNSSSGDAILTGSQFDFGKAPQELRSYSQTQSHIQQNDSSSSLRGSRLYETNTINSSPVAISEQASRVPREANSVTRQPLVESGDVIDRGLLTTQAAFAAFDHFVSNMIVHFPIIVIPTGTSAATTRQSKPILFLAIMSAACAKFQIALQRQINQQLMAVFADQIIKVGEKSLELIQALQVAMIWYHPPGRYEELKYYQLIHCAGVMAIEMGLSRKGKPKKSIGLADPKNGKPALDPGAIEGRRAWLGCYFMAAHTAQNLRRTNLIRWSPYLDNCLEILETSSEAIPSDLILCHWVRLQHISDDVGMQFSIEDPATCNGLDDPKVRFAMNGFESQLQSCSETKIPKTAIMTLGEEIGRIYMHEVALHAGQNNYDFQPPFTEEILNSMQETPARKLTAGHIDSLSTCLASTHTVFDMFLSLPVDIVRNLPTFHMVRLVYAAVVLIKMAIDSTVRESVVGKILKVHDFKIEEYLGKLTSLLSSAADGDKCQSAAKFKMILMVLRTLFYKHTINHTHRSAGSSQSIPANQVVFANDRSVLQDSYIQQRQDTEFMSLGVTSERPQRSTSDTSRRNSYDERPHMLSNSSEEGPSQMLSDLAVASVDGHRDVPDGRMPEYPRPDTLMADDFNYESMALDLNGENFSSFFVNDELMNSVLDSVPPDFFNT